MRSILALLIVFMHSFTCYDGSWKQPASYVDILLYKWLARISFAFTLEAFVFISGYLFAFQRITLQRTGGILDLVINKLKRLFLPSIIFSIIYFILFYSYNGLGNAVYPIINGCGHMWYLPMLFWCFIGGWLLEQVKIKDVWKMVFLVIINLLIFVLLPLRLSSAASYMVYFYGGYLFYKHKDEIKDAITPKRLVISWIVFALFFTVLRPLRDVLVTEESYPVISKFFIYLGNHACQLVYAWTGIIAFYGTTVYYTQRHNLTNTIQKISSCSFGIYLLQQFVLCLLYYKTSFPTMVGPYWLPWLGFVIAAIISYFISSVLLKTKVGRFLIG